MPLFPLPKFKLIWVELQSKKDQYTQMLLDEMRLCIDVDDFSEDVVAEDNNGKTKDKTNKNKLTVHYLKTRRS